MAGSETIVKRYSTPARVFANADIPSTGANWTHTAGVPAGDLTTNLGVTQGGTTVQYRPSIALVDVDQYYGGLAPHLSSESMQINTTLLESAMFTLERISQQGYIRNLAPNSSFEYDADANGTADSWNQSGTSTRTIQTDSQGFGTKAQQFVTGGTAGGILSDAIYHPRLSAGNIVVVSAYGKSVSGTPNLTVKVEGFDIANVSTGSASSTATALNSSTWTRVSKEWTVAAATAYVKITVHDATGQTATIKVDNVQLETVASGSTPTTYIAGTTLFGGGRTAVTTYSLYISALHSDNTAKAWAAGLYSTFSSDGFTLTIQRGMEQKLPVTWTGIPIAARNVGDQVGQIIDNT